MKDFTEKVNKKIAKKKDSKKLRHAERINASAFDGLTSAQVEDRKKQNLVNKKPKAKSKSTLRIYLDNIFNFCNTIIIILCIILIAMGEASLTLSSSMIILNIAIGIYQELKAKKIVQKLSLVNKATCDVVRDSTVSTIDSEEIVLDDVCVLTAGQQIPIDGEVLDGVVEVDESILTGESDGVKKVVGDKVMAGSAVLSGEAAVRVERVGKDCYIQAITNIAKKINKPESRLFTTIDKIIKIFSAILVVLGALMLGGYFIVGTTGNEEWHVAAVAIISSLLGMIPCGMFLITSTALAESVIKLAKSNALPQDIYSIEMLAMVDTLLLDKTGTITDGELEVLDTFIMNDSSLEEIKDIVITLNEATKDKKPTAQALSRYCEGGKELECLDALPFSSKRKFSALTLDNNVTYILGAPDFIVANNEKVKAYCDFCAQEGRRTILLASFDGDIDSIDINKTTPICIFSIEEKLKEDVKSILSWFDSNDVAIKIISGDNPLTVSAIAAKAGVKGADRYVNCSELTDEELKGICSEAVVFGRVSPEQKVLIVNELKRQRKCVGMIGDGVNDVQALKAANCSISFGNAHEVARNISRIVLLDNNFGSMPSIVDEGRRVISNIEKVSSMYIMKNIFIMFMTLVFAITNIVTKGNMAYPYTTQHMLLVEFFVIGAPTFIFALMPNQERPKGSFVKNVIKKTIPSTIAIIVAASIAFILGPTGLVETGTNYATSISVLALTFEAFICAFLVALPINKIRVATILVAIALALAAVYVDFYALDGALINVQLPTNLKDIGIVFGSVVVGLAMNGLTRLFIDTLDKKYGDQIEKKYLDAKEKIKQNSQKLLQELESKKGAIKRRTKN